MSTEPPIDVDALMAEVRARVRAKRERGIYSDEVASLLRVPLPGGAPLLADELAEPLAALPNYLGTDIAYDPTSRRPGVGRLVTLARRSLMGLLRWWIHEIVARQDRVNKLVLRQLEELEQRSAPRVEERLRRLEDAWRRREVEEVAGNLDSLAFAERFGGADQVVRAQGAQFVPLFRGRTRVLDLGCGRGTFLELMREEGIGAYGVDSDPRMVERCVARGLEAYHADALAHLAQLREGSLDGVFAAHFAEHLEPGRLVEVLRQCRRVLRPSAPIVMVTPNVANLGVGGHTFWLDPSHRRPLPRELFHYLLQVAEFVEIETRAYAPTEGARLSEDVPEGPLRENARLLNATLFGDRDCAVIGFVPK